MTGTTIGVVCLRLPRCASGSDPIPLWTNAFAITATTNTTTTVEHEIRRIFTHHLHIYIHTALMPLNICFDLSVIEMERPSIIAIKHTYTKHAIFRF